MSTALVQEVRFGISYKKQVNLATALTASDMWSLRQTNEDFMQTQPNNEDDSADLGKGVYTTKTFPSHLTGGGNFNARLTSENFAQAMAFGLGAVVKSTSGGGFRYRGIAPIFSVVGLDLPVATAVVQIRTGADAITDKTLIGLACEEFGLELKLGPGRDNALFTSNWLGTGNYTKPSGIVIPDIYAEHSMNAGDVSALTFSGFDYLANLRFIGTKFGWKNNIRDQSSYFPGSGTKGGYQLRGRVRRGVPTISLSTEVECDSGSSEEDLLLNQTPGAAQITMAAASPDNGLDLQFFQIVPNATPIGNSDGIAKYDVTWSVQQHPTNGVLQIDATCLQDGLLST